MPAGRPQEYNPTYTEQAKEYLQRCDADLKELPSIEGLAVFLGIARSTIYEWKNKYPAFSDIVEKILAEQSKKLINNGLSGKFNASITKLILTKHGYSDKTETDITTKGEPITGINYLTPSEHNFTSDSETTSGLSEVTGQDD